MKGFQVKPAAPSYWDAYARMTLEVLEEARISQFVLEECAEETTRFSVEEQIAAVEMQAAISQWSAMMDKRFGVNEEVKTQIRNLKKKVVGKPRKLRTKKTCVAEDQAYVAEEPPDEDGAEEQLDEEYSCCQYCEQPGHPTEMCPVEAAENRGEVKRICTIDRNK